MRVRLCFLVAVVTFVGLGVGARGASAQAVILGSSAVGRLGEQSLEPRVRVPLERAPRFATCDDAAGCKGLHPYHIDMEVFPHWELRVPLPVGFMLTNHNWTMEHDSVALSLRQARGGGTLRYQRGDDWWLELGGALAEQSVSRPVVSDVLASGDVGRMLPALLAGAGGWVHLGAHADLDVRLRGGMSVGDGGDSVYHANLVLAFEWQ